MTKVLFLVFFYSALFPAVFFFGFAILTVQYFVRGTLLLKDSTVRALLLPPPVPLTFAFSRLTSTA
jgi:hypothetical protein